MSITRFVEQTAAAYRRRYVTWARWPPPPHSAGWPLDSSPPARALWFRWRHESARNGHTSASCPGPAAGPHTHARTRAHTSLWALSSGASAPQQLPGRMCSSELNEKFAHVLPARKCTRALSSTRARPNIEKTTKILVCSLSCQISSRSIDYQICIYIPTLLCRNKSKAMWLARMRPLDCNQLCFIGSPVQPEPRNNQREAIRRYLYVCVISRENKQLATVEQSVCLANDQIFHQVF